LAQEFLGLNLDGEGFSPRQQFVFDIFGSNGEILDISLVFLIGGEFSSMEIIAFLKTGFQISQKSKRVFFAGPEVGQNFLPTFSVRWSKN
jgi:hypothetical protein